MLTPSQVNVRGSVRRQVTCESCGHQYDYEMTRTAAGSYHGFAWNDRDGQAKALPGAENTSGSSWRPDAMSYPAPNAAP